MTLDEYLRNTVFYRPRSFGVEEFKACMLAQSAPFRKPSSWLGPLSDRRYV